MIDVSATRDVLMVLWAAAFAFKPKTDDEFFGCAALKKEFKKGWKNFGKPNAEMLIAEDGPPMTFTFESADFRLLDRAFKEAREKGETYTSMASDFVVEAMSVLKAASEADKKAEKKPAAG